MLDSDDDTAQGLPPPGEGVRERLWQQEEEGLRRFGDPVRGAGSIQGVAEGSGGHRGPLRVQGVTGGH